jgi:hypothetical protein
MYEVTEFDEVGLKWLSEHEVDQKKKEEVT